MDKATKVAEVSALGRPALRPCFSRRVSSASWNRDHCRKLTSEPDLGGSSCAHLLLSRSAWR